MSNREYEIELYYTKQQKKVLDLLDEYYTLAQTTQYAVDKGKPIPIKMQDRVFSVYEELLHEYGIARAYDSRPRHRSVKDEI